MVNAEIRTDFSGTETSALMCLMTEETMLPHTNTPSSGKKAADRWARHVPNSLKKRSKVFFAAVQVSIFEKTSSPETGFSRVLPSLPR